MAERSFLSRLMNWGRPEMESEASVSQINASPNSDKTHEFNTSLGTTYLNVVSYGASCNAPYSPSEIMNMAKNPMLHITQLRRWARWAYYSNGTVTTAIDSLVSLHSKKRLQPPCAAISRFLIL